MSTTTAPATKAGLLSTKAEGYSANTIKMVSKDMMRSLFYNRIAQIELSSVGKSELLHEDIRKAIHQTADTLRQLDMKVRGKLTPTDNKWLSTELSKDKLFDIAQLIELAAHVSSEGTDTDYEGFMSLITNFLDKTVHLQVRNKCLNMAKYKALERFMTEEMTAEVEGGQTAVEYNSAMDSLSFRLVQPDAQIPSRVLIV